MTQTARNYAKALYELNVDAESIKTTEDILEEVKELRESLANPIVSFRVKEKIIDRVFPKGTANFLKVVCRNQKADILLDIFVAYHDAKRKARGVLRANLIYVTAPTKEQEEKIKAFLCKTYHVKSAELSMKEDKSLIGGFILQAENREFDWSLRGRFQSLSQALKH